MSEDQKLCPICTTAMTFRFSTMVLGRYQVKYFECPGCLLINTETPYWLDDAYESAIADMDTGMVQRNIEMSKVTSRIIEANFDQKGVFLDYAGGYGLFVRLMRDKGFDFHWHDDYCDNIFARHFQMPEGEVSFELVTAFEVLEHIVDPIAQMRRILQVSNSILLTTEIRPESIEEVENWWYLVPETGQHVVFHSLSSLEALARKLDMHFYSNGRNLHMFSRDVRTDPFSCSKDSEGSWFTRRLGRFWTNAEDRQRKVESLTWSDHLRIREAARVKQRNGQH